MRCISNHIFMFPFSLKGCGEIQLIRKGLQDIGWYRDGFVKLLSIFPCSNFITL